jgi:hypothetical protein
LLRSTFRIDDGSWWVPGHADPPVTGCAADRFAGELVRPFDYGRGPVARLVVAADRSASLVGVAVDHLISDGWSLATIWAELRAHYELAACEKTVQARKPEESFVGYLDGQQAIVDGAAVSGRLARLDGYLSAGAIPTLRLPGRGTAGDVRTALRKGHLHQHIEAAAWRDCGRAAGTIGMSGPNLLLAALHAALAEHTGESRIGATTTLANRLRPADERAIGWYAGKIVVMANAGTLADDPLGYLLGWRDSYWTALDFSDIPWAYQLHRLNPEDFGAFTRKPYATFNFQPAVAEPPSSTGWYRATDVAPVDIATGSRDAALGTFWFENEHGVGVDWEYQAGFLGADEVRAIWRLLTGNLDRFGSVLLR